MKAVIRNLLVVTSLVFLCCCTFKSSLTKPVLLSYKGRNIEANFEITEKAEIKKQSWEKGGNRYFYYGSMSAKLTSKESPKALRFIYENEDAEVYPDTISSVIKFWDISWYDLNNSRKNKIYVVFDDPNVDWKRVKIAEE
jgi:hypothetical protein